MAADQLRPNFHIKFPPLKINCVRRERERDFLLGDEVMNGRMDVFVDLLFGCSGAVLGAAGGLGRRNGSNGQ